MELSVILTISLTGIISLVITAIRLRRQLKNLIMRILGLGKTNRIRLKTIKNLAKLTYRTIKEFMETYDDTEQIVIDVWQHIEKVIQDYKVKLDTKT